MSAKVCLQRARNSQEKRILILPRLNWNTVFCATAVAWLLCWHSNSLQPHPRSVTNICCVCNNNYNVIGSCTGCSRPPPSPFLISSVVVNRNKEIYRKKCPVKPSFDHFDLHFDHTAWSQTIRSFSTVLLGRMTCIALECGLLLQTK